MNGHDFTLEQNTEARMMLAVARRGLAAAINDAENGIRPWTACAGSPGRWECPSGG